MLFRSTAPELVDEDGVDDFFSETIFFETAFTSSCLGLFCCLTTGTLGFVFAFTIDFAVFDFLTGALAFTTGLFFAFTFLPEDPEAFLTFLGVDLIFFTRGFLELFFFAFFFMLENSDSLISWMS